MIGSLDFALSIGVTVVACLIWPWRVGHILLGVFGADLPDLTYIPIIVFGEKLVNKILPFYPAMIRFLAKIQWSESPAGFVTEVAWAIFMLTALNLLR